MAAKRTVLILGDSTSMTIGMERVMHPFVAASRASWPAGTEMLNCSLPGFTSADAAAFFFKRRKSIPHLAGVVIYLGNCDSASTELRKGPYGALRQAAGRVKEALGVKRGKTSLQNRLLHFEWNGAYDPAIEAPERPADFEFNLARVLGACRDVPVALVRPLANRHFPPGTGKGNFLFYRYLGLRERIASRLSIPDGRFKEALAAHEAGDHADAIARYREILLAPSRAPMSAEYALLVTHNYAAACVEAGNDAEGEHLFKLLLKEPAARKEIALFNLAHIARKRGDRARAEELISASYEADASLYRIRAPYLEAIDRLAARFPRVRVVDLRKIVKDGDFLDHCHPLAPAQERIAAAVTEALAPGTSAAGAPCAVRNELYNPEFALGNSSEFFSYYKTYAPFSVDEIRGFRRALDAKLTGAESPAAVQEALKPFPQEFRTAVEYYLKHPAFPSAKDAVRFGPVHPSDMGRFPEFFLFRHLAPYLRAHELDGELRGRFSAGGPLRSSADLVAALPEAARPLAGETGEFDAEFEASRLPRILERVRRDLSAHLRRGGLVHERMKTTIFWYVRETLRFGSHSRHSMRYDRVALEYMAEALAVAGTLDARLGGKRSSEILGLVASLEEAVSVHEDAAKRYSFLEDTPEFHARYDERLRAVAEALEGAGARR